MMRRLLGVVEPTALQRRAEVALDMTVFGIAVVPIVLAGAIAGAMGLGVRATLLAAERLVDGPARA